MSIKFIYTSGIAIVFATCAFTAQANNGGTDHRWMPQQPTDSYWQSPNWSGFNMPPNQQPAQPANRPPAPPAYNYNYQAPAAPAYRQQRPAYNSPAQNAPAYRQQRPVYNSPPQNAPADRQQRPAYNSPPQNAYRPNMNQAPQPVQNTNRSYPPPPAGPYRGAPYYGPNSGPSAFNTPGYNPYRRNNSGRNNNKFWGRSGPGTWMNPNKGNMERGWDDMINSPSRMGEMPGGWTAPEVTMPNPIDIGDQVQDNVQDLPEQMKNMDVGKDVN